MKIEVDTHDEDGCFGVVVEGGQQGPILMEGEGHRTSLYGARDFLNSLLARGQYFRGCVVRLVPVHGNSGVLEAMRGGQK